MEDSIESIPFKKSDKIRASIIMKIILSIKECRCLTRTQSDKPALLFRVMQVLYTIQYGCTLRIEVPLDQIREQIVGQFHKEYQLVVLKDSLDKLQARGLVDLSSNGWVITSLGNQVVNTLRSVKELKFYTRKTNSQNILIKCR